MQPPAHRLFFAIQPDAEAADRIQQLLGALRRRHDLTGRAIARPRLHITLAMAGASDAPPSDDTVAWARRAASRIAERPFVVALNHVQAWIGEEARGPVVLLGDEGVIGVHQMRDALKTALGGRTVQDAHYQPHLTLLYDRIGLLEQTIDPIRWMVRDFVLIHSPYGQGVHNILGRWPLGA